MALKRTSLWAATAVAAALLGLEAKADAPPVVASIPPVHSLVAAVMHGAGTPELLLPPGASPHVYALKPRQAQSLSNARLVFWVGEAIEEFLEHPLETLSGDARVVALAGVPGVTVLEAREGGAWDAHAHDHHGHEKEEHGHHDAHAHEKEHEHEKEEHGHHDEHAHEKEHEHEKEYGHEAHHGDEHTDLHLWLDPMNAKVWTGAIAAALAEADPVHADLYRTNADRLRGQLDALDAELATALAPVKTKPFIVFHDAYQYFEARYGLAAVGSITVDPERSPGARRVAELHHKIEELGAVCVFAEPQFEPKLVTTIVEGTGARRGTLDPVGADIAPGPGMYFGLLRGLAADLKGCLTG